MTGSAVRRLFGAACVLAAALGAAAAGTQAGAAGAPGGGARRVALRLAPGLSAPEHAALERAGAYGTHPVRLLIVGDSIAMTLGIGLSVDARARYGVTVVDQATDGCDLDPQLEVLIAGAPGPATPGCDDWRGLWPFLVAARQPQVVALGLGRWEVTDHLLHGEWVHIGEPAWDAHLAADLGSAIAILHTFGAKVVLFTMPYVDPSDRQPDGLPWPENTPARARAYNALVRQVALSHPGVVSVIDLNRMLSPNGRYRRRGGRRRRALGGRDPRQHGRRRAVAAPDPARDRPHRHGERGRGKGQRVTDLDPGVADAPAAEVVVESVPAAMALAPNAVGPTLGAELLLDAEARPGVQSMRAGLLQAGPLAAAGVLANGASVLLTIALARCSRHTATGSSTS